VAGPLPDDVIKKLDAVENSNARYFFYDGTSQPESMVKSVFKKVSRAACSELPFPSVRDTFAVSLLLKGVSPDSASSCWGIARSRSPNGTTRRG
jgi:hypothetical protein